ncbi:MAG: hypothetical protein ACP5NP_15070 [Acetobacteraceae bacterium]
MLLLGLFYAAMVGAGYSVELAFAALGLEPEGRRIAVLQAGISWNYTTVLNILGLALSALLVWRFTRTGGPGMLAMMGNEGDAAPAGGHARLITRMFST